MSSVWTPAQINRYTLQAEEFFCNEYKVLIERFALDIVQGTDLYTMPDNCHDIRRITYLGLRLLPISHRTDRVIFDGINSQAPPRYYVYNNLGQGVIKLFPAPSVTIIADQTNLFEPSSISTQCIVEYYAVPDGISIKLPEYMRRRALKAFVLRQCFLAEGKGQNLKAASYWDNKWKAMLQTYGDQLYEVITSARKIMNPAVDIEKYLPPVAQLPISKQGIGLDPGE